MSEGPAKRFKAEKSDYVLAKGPDGKRVWIHKVTGQILQANPNAPAAGSNASPAGSAPQAVSAADELKRQMQAAVSDLSTMLGAAPPPPPETTGPGLPAGMLPPPPPGIPPETVGMDAYQQQAMAAMIAGGADPAEAQAALLAALAGGVQQAGVALGNTCFQLVPAGTLLAEDYDLMAGKLTADDYNASLARLGYGQNGLETAASALANAQAAQAAYAAAAATPGMAGVDMSGVDPGALMYAMGVGMAAAGSSEGGMVADGGGALFAKFSSLSEAAAAYEEPDEPGEEPVVAAGYGQQAAMEAAAQPGMDLAMASQLMQLNRFHMQQRVFETQKNIASGDMPTRFKEGFKPMQLCKQFVNSGSCVRGDSCSYAHTPDELHPMSPDAPGAEQAKMMEALEDSMTPSLADQPEPSLRMQRKRAMCQRLSRNQCMLGKKCPFAHHESELGTVGLAITGFVKTQLCKFFEQGKCVYGKYCVNAHGNAEIGKPKPEYLVPPGQKNAEENGNPGEKGGGGGGKGKHRH